MSYDQFISTKRYSEDLRSEFSEISDWITPVPGHIYLDHYYILDMGSGSWELHYFDGDEVSGDLDELEQTLYREIKSGDCNCYYLT